MRQCSELSSWGVPEPDLALLRKRLPQFGKAATMIDHRQVIVFAGVDRASLATLLDQGLDAYVEWTGLEDTAQILAQAQTTLAVSTTTRTTFRALNGAAVSGLMARRGMIEPTRVADIGSAIQEALANAVIHGNLTLERSEPAEEDDFIAFHRTLAQRIESPVALSRRVTIDIADAPAEVVVKIADQGAGFDPTRAIPDPKAPSGRGLRIMTSRSDALHFEDGGRVAALTFLKARPAAPLPLAERNA